MAYVACTETKSVSQLRPVCRSPLLRCSSSLFPQNSQRKCLGWGNIHQLCVQHILRPSRAGKDFDLSPSQAQRKVWDFVQCQNYDGVPSIGKVGLARQCLSTIRGPRWEEDGVRECAEGSLGRKLLRRSVEESKRRQITKSATIQLDGKTICIRDGGEWQDCPGGHETNDFLREIETVWRKKNDF